MRSAVILAAGKGTRMQSAKPKVLHEILGKSMILHVVQTLKDAKIQKIVVILGHESELVKENLANEKHIEFAYQHEQLGTADALKQAKSNLGHISGSTIVVCGDTPLLTRKTITEIFEQHEKQEQVDGCACTVLTGELEDASGYGRIIRNVNHEIIGIIEEKDATSDEKLVKEFNSGVYCLSNAHLFENLEKITNNNTQSEYYLPDIIKILKIQKKAVASYIIKDNAEIIGVNDRVALSDVTTILRHKINHGWQLQGVTMHNPETIFIGRDVIIAKDVIIETNVKILGNTRIASDTIIGMNSEINNCTIAENVIIKQSVISDSIIGAHTTVGPFAHLRQQCEIGKHTRIGNFVEFKNTRFADYSASAHLTYLGDAEIGHHVNIGCGTITANYNGVSKSKTIIGNSVFIGSNSNLIAPITIHNGAFIGAGSTLMQDIPENAFAMTRGPEILKEGYATILKQKYADAKK